MLSMLKRSKLAKGINETKEKLLAKPNNNIKTIPFKTIYSNGMINSHGNYFSKVCSLGNINYTLAKEEMKENIFANYCKFLNGLTPEVGVQLFLNNININQHELLDILMVKSKKFPELADEYNQIMEDKVMECHDNTSEKKLYIIFTVQSDKIDKADDLLNNAISAARKQFKKIQSPIKELAADQILGVLYDYYNPKLRKTQPFTPPQNLFTKGMKIQECVAPSSFKFKINHAHVGDTLVRTFYIKDLPTSLKDEFISDLLDVPFSMSVSIHIEPTDSAKAVQFIKRRLTAMEANKLQYVKRNKIAVSESMVYIPYDLKNAIEEAKELLDQLVKKKNKKLFFVSIYFSIQADNLEDLEEYTKQVQSTCGKHIVHSAILNHQQEDGIASVLPVGWNKVGLKRTLLTDSTAVFMPYSSQNIIHEGGYYYGINQLTNSLIVLNRKHLKNPAGFILAMPRTGKSFAAKSKEIVPTLFKTQDDIIIIDPEGEYCDLAENFDGEVIKISSESLNYINPMDMDMDYGADEGALNAKSEFILSFCECIMKSLTPGQKSIIDRCVRYIYTPYIQSNFEKSKTPTLQDLYDKLLEQNDADAEQVAKALEMYVTGGLNYFNHKTNVDVQNRFTVFNLKELRDQLKTIGLLNVTDFVWNRVCQNAARGKRTWIYMDEFHIFFYSLEMAHFFNNFFKRSQKRGGIPTGITQNISEVLSSQLAKNMLSNSEFLILLKQSENDQKELSNLLGINDDQLEYVKGSGEGEGLMMIDGKIYAWKDEFVKESDKLHSRLYDMMNTKVDEVFLKRGGKA